MTKESSDPQEITKLKIREWLKENGLSIKWLASWLNRSEGTAKNWFYGTKQITEENLDSIEVIQNKYYKQEISRELNPEYYSSIQDLARAHSDSSILTIGFFEKETDAILVSHAIGVNVGAFRNYTDETSANIHLLGHYIGNEWISPEVDRARYWVEQALTSKTKTLLSRTQKEYKSKGKIFSVLNLPTADMSNDSREEMSESDRWYIEVDSSFKLLYARIAARVEGYTSFNKWINESLVQVATHSIDSDLKEFLSGDDSRTPPQDDGIPF